MGAQVIDSLRAYVQQYPEHLEQAASEGAEKVAAYVRSMEFRGTEEEWVVLRSKVIAAAKTSMVASQQGMAKAAALVFWHAAAEATAYDLCVLIGKMDPTRWDSVLSNKRIEFREVLESDADAIRQRLLKQYLKAFEQLSFVAKLDQLHNMCGGGRTWTWSKLYKYNEDLLKEIDGKRHEMVHGNGLKSAHKLSDDDLDYLRTTPLYLLNLVAYSFELQLFGKVPKIVTHSDAVE